MTAPFSEDSEKHCFSDKDSPFGNLVFSDKSEYLCLDSKNNEKVKINNPVENLRISEKNQGVVSPLYSNEQQMISVAPEAGPGCQAVPRGSEQELTPSLVGGAVSLHSLPEVQTPPTQSVAREFPSSDQAVPPGNLWAADCQGSNKDPSTTESAPS